MQDSARAVSLYPGTHSAIGISLNLGTTLAGVTDVYDAMRSDCADQSAFPTDRILAMLQQNDGKQFHQNLVRRFVQLVGIDPGSLVELDTGEICRCARAVRAGSRSHVRILLGADGQPWSDAPNFNLWEADEDRAHSTRGPVNPADHGIDPLMYL